MANRPLRQVASWERLCVTGLVILAAALSAFCGSRGLFAFDESILFDGGFRVLSGQVPYRDFLSPFGPAPFVIQGLFFTLFGVNWSAFLSHAALVNGLAALIVWWLVRGVDPASSSVRVIALLAAALTGSWFYPPMGVPFFEQTAFFFHLCGLAALRTSKGGAGMAAGACFMMACLSKQNAGLLSVAMGLWISWRSGVLRQAVLGFAATGLAFASWLLAFSDPRAFWRWFVQIPLAEAQLRLGRMESLAGYEVTLPGQIECGFVGLAAIAVFRRRPKGASNSGANPLEIALGLLLFRLGLASLTNNSALGLFGFLGLSTGLALAGALRGGSHSPLRLVVLSAPLVLLIALGVRTSVDRVIHDFWWEARFDDVRVSRELWPARWGGGDGTRAPRVPDFDAVVARLRRGGEAFFVFPDTTVMYGLAGRASAQPLVWFHKGVTYPHTPDPELDARLVQALVRSRVTAIVIEDVTFLGTERRLNDFPSLRRFIEAGFALEETHGIFRVFKARPARESGPPADALN